MGWEGERGWFGLRGLVSGLEVIGDTRLCSQHSVFVCELNKVSVEENKDSIMVILRPRNNQQPDPL